MSLFEGTFVPIYDDQVGTADVLQEIVRKELGPSEKDVPVSSDIKQFVQSLEEHSSNGLMSAWIDLHDTRYQDMSIFNKANVSTERGQFTGLRLLDSVIAHRVQKGTIKNVPFAIVSSHWETLDEAKQEFEQSLDGAPFLRSMSVEFLKKPTSPTGAEAKAVQSYILDKIIRPALNMRNMTFFNPDTDFPYLEAISGFQRVLALTDLEMAKIFAFEKDSERGYKKFKRGELKMPTREWRERTILLYNFFSTVVSPVRSLSSKERESFAREWIREPRTALSGQAPIELLLSGSQEKILYMLAFLARTSHSRADVGVA